MKSIRIAGRVVRMRVVIMAAAVVTSLALLIIFSSGGSEPVKKKVPKLVEEKKVDVLVAAQDIPEGVLIEANMLEWEVVYESRTARSDIVKSKMPNVVTALTKMRSRQAILAGEGLKMRYFTPVFGSALAIKVRQGYRAFTFQVDGINSVGGYVTPGDHIDVLYRIELPNPDGIPDRRTINMAQNVRVLAADNLWKREQANEKFGVRKLLTIEVTPEQAGELAAIGNNQGLFVMLRNPLDDRVNDQNILGETSQIIKQALEPSVKPEKKTKKVNVFGRGVRTVYDCGETCVADQGDAAAEDLESMYGLQTKPTSATRKKTAEDGASDDLMNGLRSGQN